MVSFSALLLCYSPQPLPPNHPISQSSPFAQANKIGQCQVAGKFEGECEDFYAFLVGPFAFEEVGNFYFEAGLNVPAYAAGECNDVGGQEAFEEGELFGDAGKVSEHIVILGVKGFPLVYAVGDGLFQYGQAVLVHAQVRDAHVHVFIADAQRPVGLAKEMVGFFNALVEAKQHGPHFALEWVELVLDEGVALVVAAVFVVVVVKPLVFQPNFVGNGAAKFG